MEYATRIREFLKERFHLEPKNIDVFVSAFTHCSIKGEAKTREVTDYDKLEFLGDSCIGLVISECLYQLDLSLKNMASFKKEIVQSNSLAYVSTILGLDKLIRVGKGCSTVTLAMKEDIYESFIGAIYLSFGYAKAKEIILETLWKSFSNKELMFSIDYKTMLQETIHNLFKVKVEYEIDGTYTNGGGSKIFCVSVYWSGVKKGTGVGLRLKDAERDAAKDALFSLNVF